MDLIGRMEKFNKRWRVISQDSYEESLQKFKTRILNIFRNIDQHVTRDSIALFCQYYGIQEVWQHNAIGTNSWSTNIIDRLKVENREVEFYRLIELVLSLDIISSNGYNSETYSKRLLLADVNQAIEFSNVNVSIAISDDEVLLIKKGEKELDEKLVNQVFDFLNKESNEHFDNALKYYQGKNSIKSSESLRRALEEYLKFKFENTKGLDANISELHKRLKSDGLDAQVRNIISQTFSYLDRYFNENSKHNDGNINESENEYLIYQTGLLLRYINTLKLSNPVSHSVV